jgi:hypothetical protein
MLIEKYVSPKNDFLSGEPDCLKNIGDENQKQKSGPPKKLTSKNGGEFPARVSPPPKGLPPRRGAEGPSSPSAGRTLPLFPTPNW